MSVDKKPSDGVIYLVPNKKPSDGDNAKEMDKNELFEVILQTAIQCCSIYQDLGGFSRFQCLLLLLGTIMSLAAAGNHFSPVFSAFSPPFKCLNASYHSLINNNKSDLDFDSKCPDDQEIDDLECDFDSTVMARTVVTDFKLICKKEGLVPVVTSSYMAGVVIFNVLSGFLSDHYGRRTTLMAFVLVHIVASYLTAMATSIWYYLAIRFFVGGTAHGIWAINFVIASEVGIMNRRGFISGVLNLGWNVGSIFTSVLAYLLKDWVYLQLAFAVIATFLIIFYFVVPESPRWLMLNGRTKEARSAYEKIAKINNVKIDQKFDRHFRQLCRKCEDAENEEDKKSSWRHWLFLLSSHKYRLRLLLLIPPWFAVGMSSYGVHFSVSLVKYNIFLVTIIKAFITMVMILILMPVYNRSLRSPLLFLIYPVSGILAMSFYFLPSDAIAARVVVFSLTSSFIVATFFLVDSFTPELFSTDARNSTFSFLDSLSKIGTTLAPFVVALGTSYPDLPLLIFGASMTISALSFLFTQETRGQPLLQDVNDMEEQKKNTIIGKCFR